MEHDIPLEPAAACGRMMHTGFGKGGAVAQRPPIQMFVSSPADASAEREEIEKIVRRLNTQNAWRGPPLQVIRWPEDIMPGAGFDLQGVINEQVGEFDIFVGVLRSRYGTPTPRAGSGTEEELNRALEQHQHGQRPIRIMLYFSNVAVRALEIDPHQLLLVHALKQRVEALGVLPFSYNDLDQFKRLAASHIARAYGEAVAKVPLGRSQYSVNGALMDPPLERTIELGDFHFRDGVTYPQWADPKFISLAAYQRESWVLKGTFSSPSPYYRLGFKLKEAHEPSFGPGNIQTSGQNLLLHIGKNTPSEEIFFTYYKSGIRLEQDRPFATLKQGEPLELQVRCGREGLLEFVAGDNTLLQTYFSIQGIPQLIVLGWGDEHKYECQLQNITLTVTSAVTS